MAYSSNSNSGNGGVQPEQPEAPQSRTEEFSTGQLGDSNVDNHASVLEAKPNDPTQPFHANGVLQQYQRSGVGMSTNDASRRFIGESMPQPSFNGTASSNQETVFALRGIGTPGEDS